MYSINASLRLPPAIGFFTPYGKIHSRLKTAVPYFACSTFYTISIQVVGAAANLSEVGSAINSPGFRRRHNMIER